jgi:hypothetical protein
MLLEKWLCKKINKMNKKRKNLEFIVHIKYKKIKTSLKWITDPYVNSKVVKVSQENLGNNSLDKMSYWEDIMKTEIRQTEKNISLICSIKKGQICK